MMMSELKSFYNTNADFKEYVDKIMSAYGWSLEKVLQSPITKNYYQYLIESRKDKITC